MTGRYLRKKYIEDSNEGLARTVTIMSKLPSIVTI
jgi:hypothetical protein